MGTPLCYVLEPPSGLKKKIAGTRLYGKAYI